MVEQLNRKERREVILTHIGRYGFSLRPVIEKLFFEGKSCDNVLRGLTKDGLIAAHPNAAQPGKTLLIPGGYKYYQLTPLAARRMGLPESRSKPASSATFDKALGVLWFCCMQENQRLNVLEARHVSQLLADQDTIIEVPDGTYCIELQGKRRLVNVFVLGANTSDQYHLRQFQKDMKTAERHPTMSVWLKHRRLSYAFLVPNPKLAESVFAEIKRRSMLKKTDIRVLTVPTHQTLHMFLERAEKQDGGEA